MAKKLTPKKIHRIRELHQQDIPNLDIAKRLKISYVATRGYALEIRGYQSRVDYLNELARRKGFSSHYDYQRSLKEKRKSRDINQVLGNLIDSEIKKRSLTNDDFGAMIGIDQTTIREYRVGNHIPSKTVLEKIFEVLEIEEKLRKDIEALIVN